MHNAQLLLLHRYGDLPSSGRSFTPDRFQFPDSAESVLARCPVLLVRLRVAASSLAAVLVPTCPLSTRWLSDSVRRCSGAFTSLSPRVRAAAPRILFAAVAVLKSDAGDAVLPVRVDLWIMRVSHAGIVIQILRSVMLRAMVFIALVGHAAVHGRKESAWSLRPPKSCGGATRPKLSISRAYSLLKATKPPREDAMACCLLSTDGRACARTTWQRENGLSQNGYGRRFFFGFCVTEENRLAI